MKTIEERAIIADVPTDEVEKGYLEEEMKQIEKDYNCVAEVTEKMTLDDDYRMAVVPALECDKEAEIEEELEEIKKFVEMN